MSKMVLQGMPAFSSSEPDSVFFPEQAWAVALPFHHVKRKLCTLKALRVQRERK
uniref:Uncharacterized protein n=1 Tax=Setaria italica TaxID=4555 RepID=K4AHY9_SETIT